MEFFQWERNPWGQEILVRISWDLFWAAAAAGLLFILGHLLYRWKWAPKAAGGASGGTAELAATIPERVVRHGLASRLFHWLMSVSVLVLLVTGFLPVLGIQFSWITIHWIAGLVLIGTVIFHTVHASFWQNLRDIWISWSDWKEWLQEMQHALGQRGQAPPKPGKYPVDHKLFHHMVLLATFAVIGTGLLMMVRVETPFFARNPYLLADQTWGLVYVLHGLSSVALVGLIMAHIYFAVLPEKWWLTVSMVAGWITRKDFIENHDPQRWVVSQEQPTPSKQS
ncbi:MAG: cytochrome b/b6 domain-containing protein [Acidobacteriota bacterium]